MKVLKSLSARELFSRDQGELPGFLRRLFTALPTEVVQPHTLKEAADVVRSAYRNGAPVVPRGAGSTAFGQVVPVLGGLVLDLSFLKRVGEPDLPSRTVAVEAGARWADIAAFLEPRGLALRTYPSSWYSTVGGWIATGGVGMQTLGFGPLRDSVAELLVCVRDGTERRLKSGEPLFEAFFETEGQMGVVLEAVLRVRPLAVSTPVLIPCESSEEAWRLYADAAAAGPTPLHASLYSPERMRHFNHTLEAKMERRGSEVKGPFREAWSVLLVVEDPAAAARFAGAAPAFQAAYVWEERFYPLKGKSGDQMFLGNEVRLENARGAAYAADLERMSRERGLRLAIEVNAASATESLVIASFFASYEDPELYLSQLSAVFAMDELGCVRHGGKLYHIGLYNTPFLGRKFGDERLAALRRAKGELDPRGLFNPGKFFELKTALTRVLPDVLHRLGFKLALPVLKSPALSRLLLKAGGKRFDPEPPASRALQADAVFKTARECVNCGFCIPVCPAYLATKDERTTARGKLFLAQKWLRGGTLEPEDVVLLHSCMHCGACTSVCQNSLDLVPAWHDIESRVAAEHGKPEEAIKAFVKDVEASPDYYRLLRQGHIAEPPTLPSPARGEVNK